jgi:tripartite ATP-independent transporter DctP family solute receptor
VFRIAYTAGPSELLHQAAVRIASNTCAASSGALEVRVYPGGQLGNERELTEGLNLRTVDMVISGLAIVGWYAPEYGVFEAPFVWRDFAHVEAVWDGPIGADLRHAMQERAGIRLLRPWFRGPRYLTTSTKKVLAPEDLRGMKLRVPELEVYIKAWQTFGANVTPIPFTDIFMALKLGIVEGQENPLATICANHLDEVQRYVMETRHLVGFYVPALGPSFERRFNAQQRRWILAAFDEATRWHNREVERMEADYRAKLEAGGMEFVPIDPEPFREIARRQIPPLFSTVWKAGLYEAISAGR